MHTSISWLSHCFSPFRTQSVIIDVGAAASVDQYQFATANDCPERDPTAWRVGYSQDQVTWTTLREVRIPSPPRERFAFYDVMPMSADETTALSGSCTSGA
jgi:hypothetical protein